MTNDDNDTSASALEITFAKSDWARRAKEVAAQARYLARDLEHLAAKLEGTGRENATFNTLGEIQGRGSDIDRQLGELGVLREAIRTMENILRYAKKGD